MSYSNCNVMKYLEIIVCIFALCLCACNSETENVIQETEIGILEARNIARTYLTIEDGEYFLDLSIDDAKEKGISRHIYTQLVQEVEESNLFLKELMDRGKKITLINPQEIEGNSNLTVKTRSEKDDNILQQGMMSVKNYQTSISISAPRGAKEIKFTGTTPCLLAAISVTCNGSTKTITSGPWGGSCSFEISYSPCVLKVTTYTLCSGGGSLGYIIYK